MFDDSKKEILDLGVKNVNLFDFEGDDYRKLRKKN